MNQEPENHILLYNEPRQPPIVLGLTSMFALY